MIESQAVASKQATAHREEQGKNGPAQLFATQTGMRRRSIMARRIYKTPQKAGCWMRIVKRTFSYWPSWISSQKTRNKVNLAQTDKLNFAIIIDLEPPEGCDFR